MTTLRGSITGTYQLHNTIEVSSETGSLDLLIELALGNKDRYYDKRLLTKNAIGHSKIKVQQPSTHQNSSELVKSSFPERKTADTTITSDTCDLIGNGYWGDLTSLHYLTSGSISLMYPSSWSGNIIGYTFAGGISITGDGVEITADEEKYGLRTVQAHKGLENRLIIFQTDGRATLYIGDE